MEAPPSVLLCCGGVPGAENEDPPRKFERRPRTGGAPAALLPRPEPRITVPRFEIDEIGTGVVARLLLPLASSNRLSLALPLPPPGECDWDSVERWPVAVARFIDMIRTRKSPVSTRDQLGHGQFQE